MATSKIWTRILDTDPKNLKPDMDPRLGPSKTWTLKNLDPAKPGPWKNMDFVKHEINMELRNMSDFRELSFNTTIRNVICCLQIPNYIF